MNMMNKEPERHEIEALLPWHAAGTLSRREAERVDQAIARDRELARYYDLVREELAETIHLNETLGAPSARAMEKLFAAIDAEEARAPRRPRSFDLAERMSGLLARLTPRTLAWSAGVAALAILLQAGLITAVVLREPAATGSYGLASAPNNEGSSVWVRFTPHANVSEITEFLGTFKAKLVDGPSVAGGSMYRVRLAPTRLPKEEVGQIIRQMQSQSRVVGFVATAD
jgi:hypothetical protein